MSHDDVASTLGISKDAEEFINTMKIIAEQGSRRRASKKSTKITIRAKAVDDMDRPEITSRFNALNHELVPHQELVGPANVSAEEQLAIETEELAPWRMIQPDPETGEDRLAKELLPKISAHHRPRCPSHQRTRRSRRLGQIHGQSRKPHTPGRWMDCRPCVESGAQVAFGWRHRRLPPDRGG